ncbi:MAG: altronate dehydratase family protein [Granulosicoccus sp.]|nr:altronate dehydratase family protein [Granulosicoccus sp.]
MSESTPIVWLDPQHGASQPALRLADTDTVAVALRPLAVDETISVGGQSLTVRQRIMKGHKIALKDSPKGSRVIKYAQLIGLCSADIAAGDHVHTHNVAFTPTDVRSSPDDTTIPFTGHSSSDMFKGYSRNDGSVGTRNYIAVISSVNCSATVAHRIAASFDATSLQDYRNVDGVAAFTHGTGCGMDAAGEGFANLQRVIAGYARHPNVGGVLIVGLGCETSQIADTLKAHRLSNGPLLQTMNIQSAGGHVKTISRGVQMIREMLPDVNQITRSDCPVSALTLALQCGGSDAWSGITANPALGYAADLLVKQGGTAVLAETPEIYGAEHLLTRRAIDNDVAEQLMQRISWWQAYVERNDGSLDNNPSPGNKLGGLTTILEKSLGAVAKGGNSPLTGVFHYAQKVDRKGFVFMDTPGYDPASVTGQIAGGCNLVAFTTGRGSTFGSKPAPCMKIATNTDMYRQMQDDMDINAGTIVSDSQSVGDVGTEIYQRLLSIASGELTLSESHGLGDNEFVPWQIGATM